MDEDGPLPCCIEDGCEFEVRDEKTPESWPLEWELKALPVQNKFNKRS